MKKLILLIIIGFTLSQCKKPTLNTIQLFNGIEFKLEGEEKISNKDSISNEFFKSIFDQSTIQAPLFKNIAATTYNLYLGIPINTSINKILKYKSTLSPSDEKIFTDSTTFFLIKYKKDDDYILELAKNFDDNLIYVVAKTKSAKISDSLFQKEVILNRFHKKDN